MERLNYDAVALGEYEVAEWTLTDSLLGLGSTLPLVTTNVERRAGEDWKPVGARCRVVEVDGVRVGFLSVLDEGRNTTAALREAQGAVRVLPPIATTREVARLLKGTGAQLAPAARVLHEAEAKRLARERADILVLIGHLDDVSIQTFADSIPEIDVILAGTHQDRDEQPVKFGRAVVNRSGDRGVAVAVTNLVVSPGNEIVDFSGQAPALDPSWPEDPHVAAVVAATTEASRRAVDAMLERKRQERMERFRLMQAQRQRETGGGQPGAPLAPDSAGAAAGDSARSTAGDSAVAPPVLVQPR